MPKLYSHRERAEAREDTWAGKLSQHVMQRGGSCPAECRGRVFSLESVAGATFSCVVVTYSAGGVRRVPAIAQSTIAQGCNVFGTEDVAATVAHKYSSASRRGLHSKYRSC